MTEYIEFTRKSIQSVGVVKSGESFEVHLLYDNEVIRKIGCGKNRVAEIYAKAVDWMENKQLLSSFKEYADE
jgi:hypothetical protein